VRAIDVSAWDKLQGPPGSSGRQGELAYVIVGDTQEPRIAVCLAALKPYNVGVLVARNGEEALGLLHRFGPPILLVIDLSLPQKDGFAVIEAVRQAAGRTEIIAWSSRGLREFAVHHLRDENVRVVSGAVASSVVHRAIERAMRSRGASPEPAPPPAISSSVDEVMSALAANARTLCRTAGAAVYLKAAGESEFRTTVKWECEEPIPDSAADLPLIYDWILKTGEALVLPDLSRQRTVGAPALRLRENLRGLVAVPVVSLEQQITGALCVFDVKPFTFDSAEIEALKALGRGVPAKAPAVPVNTDIRPQPPARDPAPASDRAGILAVVSGAAPLMLLDRRDGNMAIARELARVRREQRNLSVILFDVDAMTLSDADADGAWEAPRDPLSTVAETLTGAVRGSDLAIRWSHEELLVVLAGLNATEARRVAERVRAAMQAGARQPVAVSGGVAELMAEDTFETVMARANQQARLAKARGHNRVS
jgi:diguanylate cyclase (GGDEF)-like protein